jgi:hypothetical protein
LGVGDGGAVYVKVGQIKFVLGAFVIPGIRVVVGAAHEKAPGRHQAHIHPPGLAQGQQGLQGGVAGGVGGVGVVQAQQGGQRGLVIRAQAAQGAGGYGALGRLSRLQDATKEGHHLVTLQQGQGFSQPLKNQRVGCRAKSGVQAVRCRLPPVGGTEGGKTCPLTRAAA